MTYVLDGLVVLIVGLMGFVGYKTGFYKTVMRLIAVVLAIAIASSMAGTLAEKIFDMMFAADLDKITEIEMAEFDGDALETVDYYISLLPDGLQETLGECGLDDPKACLEKVGLSERAPSQKALDMVMNDVIKPTMIRMLTSACMVGLFIGLFVIFYLLVLLTNNLMGLPILKQANQLLGVLVGVVEGVAIAFVLANGLSIMAAGATSPDTWLTTETLQNTYLVQKLESDSEVLQTAREWAAEKAAVELAELAILTEKE